MRPPIAVAQYRPRPVRDRRDMTRVMPEHARTADAAGMRPPVPTRRQPARRAAVTARRAAVRPVRAFARLRTQHRAMLERLALFERQLRRPARRSPVAVAAFRTLARWLAGGFAAHMAAEDGVLYPALARELPELTLTLEPLRADHLELASMTASLGRQLGAPASAERDEQLAVLGRDIVDLLRLHIRTEEHSVFDWSERVLPPATLRVLRARLSRFLTSR